MECEAEYTMDVIAKMRERFERAAKKEQAKLHEGKGDADIALRAASEYYIFVYVLKMLESLVEDVDLDEVKEIEEQMLSDRKKMLN